MSLKWHNKIKVMDKRHHGLVLIGEYYSKTKKNHTTLILCGSSFAFVVGVCLGYVKVYYFFN